MLPRGWRRDEGGFSRFYISARQSRQRRRIQNWQMVRNCTGRLAQFTIVQWRKPCGTDCSSGNALIWRCGRQSNPAVHNGVDPLVLNGKPSARCKIGYNFIRDEPEGSPTWSDRWALTKNQTPCLIP